MTQITMYQGQVNSPECVLTNPITAITTTIEVTGDIATKLQPAPNIFVIGTDESAETIYYPTAATGSGVTWTFSGVTRAFQGTAILWAAGSPVARLFTEYDHNTFKANIEDLVSTRVLQEYDIIIYRDTTTTYVANKAGTILSSGAVATSHTQILAAISACPVGGTIYVSPGTYTVTSQIAITKSLKFKSNGAIFDSSSSVLAGNDHYYIYGSTDDTTTLTVNAAKEAMSITVADVSEAVKGKLLQIYDDVTDWTPEYPGWKIGELHLIRSVAGNVISFEEGLVHSYTTTNGATVILSTPITVDFDGITFIGPSSDSAFEYDGVSFNLTKNSKLTNCTLYNWSTYGFNVASSINTLVDNCIAHDCLRAGYGYALTTGNYATNTTISNCFVYNCRHCLSNGGSGGHGQGRGLNIIGNTCLGGYTYAVDVHGIYESASFTNNYIYCESGACILSGAKYTIITGNTLCGAQGISDNSGCQDDQWLVSNNYYNGSGIFLWLNSSGLKSIICSNNVAKCLQFLYINGAYAENFVISDNILYADGSAYDGIWVRGYDYTTISDVTISGNMLYGCGYCGIKISQGNRFLINNNYIRDCNRLDDSSDGIMFADDVRNSVIDSNYVYSDTSPYMDLAIYESGASCANNLIINNIVEGATYSGGQILKTATTTIVKNNTGYKTENAGVTNVTTTGTIAHGLVGTPTWVIATPTVARNFVSITAKGATTFTVSIRLDDNTAGSTQNIYWMCGI